MKSITLSHSASPISGVGKFSKSTSYILFFIAIFLVIPVFDIPLFGLSLTAPLFLLIALEAIFKPPRPWSLIGRRYIILAVFIWLGIFFSMTANALSSGGTDIDSYGVATVVRYAYWIFIFVLTAYVISAGKLSQMASRILGWSILALVILRWGEAFIYGNIGAWTGTHLLTQNDYGFAFSTFSPFLLKMFFSERKWESRFAVFGNVLLWGAAAINGSRGSWIAILAGLTLFLVLLGFSQPRKAVMSLFFFLFMAGFAFLAFSASTRISTAVENRFSTFQNLNEEKSFMIRQLMDQKALGLFEQSPWFGVGAGRFRVSSVPLDIPEPLRYANQAYFDLKSSHNSYLGFLAENGLMGAVPFGLLLLLLTTLGFKSAVSLSRQKQYWGTAIYASFVGMSVHMWAISSLTNTANWFVYGLVAAMIILAQTEFKEKIETRISLPHPRHY